MELSNIRNLANGLKIERGCNGLSPLCDLLDGRKIIVMASMNRRGVAVIRMSHPDGSYILGEALDLDAAERFLEANAQSLANAVKNNDVLPPLGYRIQ